MKVYQRLDAGDIGGRVRDLETAATQAFNAINNAAGVTLTAAQLLQGYIDRSGAAAVNDTTPTAAQLVAAAVAPAVGDCIELNIRNRNTGTLTLVAGTGVTLEGTTTIATVYSRKYVVRFTNVTKGSEAVTLSGFSTGAN
jgi:hypothetical protein